MASEETKLNLITARNLKNTTKLNELKNNWRKQSNFQVYAAACDENEKELTKEEFEGGKNLGVFIGLSRSRTPGQFKEKDLNQYVHYTRNRRSSSSILPQWLLNKKHGRIHKLFTHKVPTLQDGWNMQAQLILNVNSLSGESNNMQPINKKMRLIHNDLVKEVLSPLWLARDAGIKFNPFVIVPNPSPPTFSTPSSIQIHHPVDITEKFETEEEEKEEMVEDDDDWMCRQCME